jgi:tRNA(His) 5'-end guanylyltransferase
MKSSFPLRPTVADAAGTMLNTVRAISRASDPGVLLGDEMKQYEALVGAQVDVSKPVVIRLDGHCFRTYTRGFSRPFDERIHRAMVGTAMDLLERFHACTAYTESDEISLIFPPHTDVAPSAMPFNGRVQKVASVTAGFASARFNARMLRETFSPSEAVLRERVEQSEAHFDSRVFNVPSVEALIRYLRWRAVHDCRRNSISMLAQAHFTHETLHGESASKCLARLEAQGVSWDATPAHFRLGTFVKKEAYYKLGLDPRRPGEPVRAQRTRVRSRSLSLTELPPEDVAALALSPFWAEGFADVVVDSPGVRSPG